MAAVAVVGLAAIAAVGATLLDDGDEPAAEAPAAGYRIVYRVADRTQTPARITRDVVEVAGPFRASLLSYDGDRLLGGSISTEDGVYAVSDAGTQQVEAVPWQLGAEASALDVSLPVARAAGTVRDDGRGSFAGRGCTWVLSRELLGSAVWGPPAGGDSARTCVADDGLVLADEMTVGGTLVRARAAETVEPLRSADLLADRSPAPLPEALARHVVRPLGDGVLDVPAPDGLRERGAVRIVELDAADPTVPVRDTQRLAWTDGREAVVLDVIDDRGASVPVRAAVTPTLRGLVLERALPGGRRLRVSSTWPLDRTQRWLDQVSVP